MTDAVQSGPFTGCDPRKFSQAKRILVVDDDDVIRRIVRKGLESSGWVCDEANNGVDAIAQARASHPDLIILDLAMPVMNGYDAAVALNREMPKIPLIMLTLYGDALRDSLPKSSAIKEVIPKSKGLSAVIQSVHKLLVG
jgi:CheY-like chemotaxis protein